MRRDLFHPASAAPCFRVMVAYSAVRRYMPLSDSTSRPGEIERKGKVPFFTSHPGPRPSLGATVSSSHHSDILISEPFFGHCQHMIRLSALCRMVFLHWKLNNTPLAIV